MDNYYVQSQVKDKIGIPFESNQSVIRGILSKGASCNLSEVFFDGNDILPYVVQDNKY